MKIINDIEEEKSLFLSVKKDIEEVYFLNNLPWVIGYSGGKDSTCTTQIIIDTLLEMKGRGLPLNKHVYIISSDTMVETPMIVSTIRRTIQNINKIGEKEGLPISGHLIRPKFDNTFWANLIGRGYPCPNQTFRWCTDRMKINPANDFITSIVNEYGEAVMVLGVRDGESGSRDRVLEEHTIEGKKLMRHTTMANAYVFAPIRKFSIQNVWDYLLNHVSPWGGDNSELFSLYRESAEDCPLIIDQETKQHATCGNSRFGCWVCTVVTKDKSLTAFINKGERWLIPLLEFRNWLYSIRDDDERRMRRRQDGTVYFVKLSQNNDSSVVVPEKGDRKKKTIHLQGDRWLDNNNQEWHLFEGPDCERLAKKYITENHINLDDGTNPRLLIRRVTGEYAQLGPGPFTFATRTEILEKLFILQNTIGNRYDLFHNEELLEIRKMWNEYGFSGDEVLNIYKRVFLKELPGVVYDDINFFDESDLKNLCEICGGEGVDFSMVRDVLELEKRNFGFNNRNEVFKGIKKTLSKEAMQMKAGGH